MIVVYDAVTHNILVNNWNTMELEVMFWIGSDPISVEDHSMSL